MEVHSSKRTHGLEGSNFDNEYPIHTDENQMSIVTSTPNTGGWRKVEKKKGRKE